MLREETRWPGEGRETPGAGVVTLNRELSLRQGTEGDSAQDRKDSKSREQQMHGPRGASGVKGPTRRPVSPRCSQEGTAGRLWWAWLVHGGFFLPLRSGLGQHSGQRGSEKRSHSRYIWKGDLLCDLGECGVRKRAKSSLTPRPLS